MKLQVTDREGLRHEEETPAKGSLMETLRELEYGVAAICGGMCSCATCHVYIDEAWLEKLPAQQSYEYELVTELHYHRPSSRLSCQIPLSASLDGLSPTLAPEE